MAGPIVEIVTDSERTPRWKAEVEDLINSVSSVRKGDDFWVKAAASLDAWKFDDSKYTGQPFILGMANIAPEEDPIEGAVLWEFYVREFGIRPDASVSVAAMCNGMDDHYILGELAVAIAERVGGIINMCGLIVPAEVVRTTSKTWDMISWQDERQAVEAFTSAMPGRAVARRYPTHNGRIWASHTVDVAFLRAWLSHPNFRMIK